ncbi:hypothetical protein [Pseudomonas sp.]|uniref:hypothetical protein n=1 Tax=Pseudomonas sp. TaxID=306 RepID=UPI00286C605B|nr:hypothetical protein [Pseudomonas sp.]
MRILCSAVVCLLSASHVFADETHIAEARQSLKNYGLSHCILKHFKEKSELEADIGRSAGAYSFMGNGMHTVVQDEDTLKVTHDPYMNTRIYVFNAYDNTSSVSKYTDKKLVMHGCLSVYNSPAFDAFIKTQDQFITE